MRDKLLEDEEVKVPTFQTSFVSTHVVNFLLAGYDTMVQGDYSPDLASLRLTCPAGKKNEVWIPQILFVEKRDTEIDRVVMYSYIFSTERNLLCCFIAGVVRPEPPCVPVIRVPVQVHSHQPGTERSGVV